TVVGSPTNPGGRSTITSFAGSAGHRKLCCGTPSANVLKSRFVVMLYGCAPACIEKPPASLAGVWTSKASTPNPGAGPMRVGSTAVTLVGVAPPPDTANLVTKVPEAPGSTATVNCRASTPCWTFTLSLLVQSTVVAPATGSAPLPAVQE